jgi:ATP-binding cassette subfamily B (MDR/TAP) protein 1
MTVDETELVLLSEPIHTRQAHTSTHKLTTTEQRIVSAQIDAPSVKIGYFSLYRYADKKEIAIMVVSALAAIAGGVAFPMMTVRPCS